MAGRIRTMKPEILDDEKTAGLSDAEFRMFQGIILLSDDHGAFRANARWLASQIWWAREPSQDPRECLATLSRLSLVTLYEHSGQVYGHVTNWARHQKIDKPSKPRLPQSTDPESSIIQGVPESGVCGCATDSRDPRDTLARHPRLTSDLRPPISDRGPPTAEGELEGKQGSESEAGKPSEPPELPEPLPFGLEPPEPPEPKAKKLKTVKTVLPVDWAPTPEHYQQAMIEGGKSAEWVESEAKRMRDWAASGGERCVDWDARFRNWLRRGLDSSKTNGPRVQPSSGRTFKTFDLEGYMREQKGDAT